MDDAPDIIIVRKTNIAISSFVIEFTLPIYFVFLKNIFDLYLRPNSIGKC